MTTLEKIYEIVESVYDGEFNVEKLQTKFTQYQINIAAESIPEEIQDELWSRLRNYPISFSFGE